MADNFNISTTQDQSNEAGGLERDNPAMTYVDFANQIARNSLGQQQQAALVQQAVENLKQSKLAGAQKQAAADLGVNPEMKDFFTVDEAVAYLKAAGIDDDQIKQFTDALGDQKIVSRSAVDTVIRKRQLTERNGQPFVATDADTKSGKTDENGDPLVSGQTYQAFLNPNTGETDYVRGGNVKDNSANMDLKQSEAAEKQWQKLDTEMNKFIRSSRGNALTQAAQRAVRALNELGEGQPLTAQVLSFIQKDVSGIFQGGVPPVTGMESEDFTTVLQKVNQLIGKYTGVQGYLHHDLGNQREYLLGLLIRLRESTVDMLKAALASEASGYQQIINDDPNRWQSMIQGKIDAAQAGLSKNAQTTMAAMKEKPAGNLPPAMSPQNVPGPAAGAQQTKSGIQYSVEE